MSDLDSLAQDLPPTWALATLGDLVDYGRTNKAEPDEIDDSAWVLELEDVEKDSSRLLQRITFGERQSKSTKNRFDAGDVLYGKLRPYLNKVLIADQPGFCTTEIVPIKCPAHLDTRFLFYWLKHPAFLRYVEAESHGMNMPRLGTEAGKAAPFVLAPRPEQTRIADQLDTLLARIKACNDHLDAIPGLLERFRQSVLTAAMSGDLTSKWRDTEGQNDRLPAFVEGDLADATQTGSELSLPSSWRIVHARNVVQPDAGIVYGIVQPGPKLASGIRYVQTTDIVDGRIQLQNLCHTSEEIANGYGRSSIRKGDVLLGIIRATKVAVVPDELEGANISRSVARLRPREGVLPKFLAYVLQSPAIQEWLRSQHRGMDMPVLNLSEVRLAPIPIAPMGEQAEIVAHVDSLFALADAIHTRYTAAFGQLTRMTPALLAKAFRGELVAQDAKDEPASQLLQRIAAAQVKVPKTVPSGKKRGRKTSEMPAAQPARQTGVPAWMDLPADAWSDHGAVHDEHLVTAMLTALLKAWGQPMPQEQARLAALLCLQPRLFTAVLPAEHAKQWRRLVGQAAEPLPAQVASLQPALNTPWRRALAGMRGRGDLLESGQGALASWSLGPEARHVDTSGWPDGRAAFTLAYLQTQGVGAVLPTLAVDAQAFVHARAA